MWYPHLREDIDSIERVNIRATKLVLHLKDLPFKKILRELKLPSLTYRRLRNDTIQTIKIVKGFDDCPFEVSFYICSLQEKGS